MVVGRGARTHSREHSLQVHKQQHAQKRFGKLQAQEQHSEMRFTLVAKRGPGAEIPAQHQSCTLLEARTPTFHIRAHAHSCGRVRVQLSRPVSGEQRVLGAEAPGESINRVYRS